MSYIRLYEIGHHLKQSLLSEEVHGRQAIPIYELERSSNAIAFFANAGTAKYIFL